MSKHHWPHISTLLEPRNLLAPYLAFPFFLVPPHFTSQARLLLTSSPPSDFTPNPFHIFHMSNTSIGTKRKERDSATSPKEEASKKVKSDDQERQELLQVQ